MFCNKCGNELDFNAAFCNQCGAPVEKDDQPEMSVEESIAFADKLKTRYSQVEKLEREVTDNEKRIASPLNLNFRQYSFFRFYWKFLVFAAIAFFVLDFITIIVAASGASDGGAIFMLILTFGVPIGILIVGIFVAAKRRDEENYAISLGNEDVKQQRKKLEEKTAELKNTLNARKRDLKQFDDMVPAQYRKSSSMAQVKALLVSGKASSFRDAFRLLR